MTTHSKLLHEDMMFNRTHPSKSTSPHPREILDLEGEEKAMHLVHLQKEYNRRLIKPLQYNARLKMQTEAARGNLDIQLMVSRQRLFFPEDTERKNLVKQVRELDKISAYSDKVAGIVKPKKKKVKQQSILEQKLEGDLYTYIKAANDKVVQLKRAQTALKKMHMTEGDEILQVFEGQKDPKESLHKQIAIFKAEQDQHLKPKQLNSNCYFRLADRKVLALRSMEESGILPVADKSGHSFFRNEAKMERLRKRPIALLTKKSISKSPQDYISQSALNPDLKQSQLSEVSPDLKQSQELTKTQGSFSNSVVSNSKKANTYKAYDLMGVRRDSRTLDNDSNNFSASPSPDLPSLKEVNNETKHRNLGFHLPIHKEAESISQSYSQNKSVSYAGVRTNSHPHIIEARDEEIVEDKEEESQTNRGIEVNQSPESQIIKEEGTDGDYLMNPNGFQSMLQGDFRSEKLLRGDHWNSIDQDQYDKLYQEDVASRKMRENYRNNLLDNIKKAKNHKGLMTDGNLHAHSVTIKKSIDINQPAILEKEPTKWVSPGRAGKRIKAVRRSKKRKNEEKMMTETDYEVYLKGLHEEKVPLGIEMQGILNRYGYKNVMVEPRSLAPPVLKKQTTGLLQDSLNKEKLRKIDEFLKKTSNKTTKAIKVD